mmetsp:Transcript_6426/g.15064  ORF Transcript_6426/g.15064 Transcript_6426/m.15064 type:complete len:255 (-) Transcript_6426:2066-2830(-)
MVSPPLASIAFIPDISADDTNFQSQSKAFCLSSSKSVTQRLMASLTPSPICLKCDTKIPSSCNRKASTVRFSRCCSGSHSRSMIEFIMSRNSIPTACASLTPFPGFRSKISPSSSTRSSSDSLSFPFLLENETFDAMLAHALRGHDDTACATEPTAADAEAIAAAQPVGLSPLSFDDDSFKRREESFRRVPTSDVMSDNFLARCATVFLRFGFTSFKSSSEKTGQEPSLSPTSDSFGFKFDCGATLGGSRFGSE